MAAGKWFSRYPNSPKPLAYLGFQSESMRHNLEAPMRLSPIPPAFELRRKMTGENLEPEGSVYRQESPTSFMMGRLVEAFDVFLSLCSGS
jgi:hypothetical protein